MINSFASFLPDIQNSTFYLTYNYAWSSPNHFRYRTVCFISWLLPFDGIHSKRKVQLSYRVFTKFSLQIPPMPSTRNSKRNSRRWYYYGDRICAIKSGEKTFTDGMNLPIRSKPSKESGVVSHRARIQSTTKRQFTQTRFSSPDQNQTAILSRVDSLPWWTDETAFYEGPLFNPETKQLWWRSRSIRKLNTKSWIDIVHQIKGLAGWVSASNNIDLHFSDCLIRTAVSENSGEMKMFVVARALHGVDLLIFFGVLCRCFPNDRGRVRGNLVLRNTGFFIWIQITILTSLIPPPIIVIGIPNCILLLNKYQQEYAKHGNKIKALARSIYRIGVSTFCQRHYVPGIPGFCLYTQCRTHWIWFDHIFECDAHFPDFSDSIPDCFQPSLSVSEAGENIWAKNAQSFFSPASIDGFIGIASENLHTGDRSCYL